MRRRVLIVDDHPSFRRFARKLFEEAGFVVVGEAGDGHSAVAAAQELRPDLVVLDVMLPDCSGLQVARILEASAEVTSRSRRRRLAPCARRAEAPACRSGRRCLRGSRRC